MNKTETLEKIDELTKEFKDKNESLKNEINQLLDIKEKINKGIEVEINKKINELSCLFNISELLEELNLYEKSVISLDSYIYLKKNHQKEHHWIQVEVCYSNISLNYNSDKIFNIFKDEIVRTNTYYDHGEILQMIPYFYDACIQALADAMSSRIAAHKIMIENLKKDISVMSEYAHIEDLDKDNHWNEYLMYLVGWISDNKNNIGNSPICYEEWLDNKGVE